MPHGPSMDQGSPESHAPHDHHDHSHDHRHDHGAHGAHGAHGGHGSLAALTLGSIGVVYGDIGTSPLYALRESLAHTAGVGSHDENVLGVVSLLIWALFLIVTIKYVIFVMRADNRGEGGTLALMALAQSALGRKSIGVLFLGILGASLFTGDAIITPAISVLSAVEGLKLVAPSLDHYILPITFVILISLFMVQSHGTGRVAGFFGPIMAVWFCSLAAMGLSHIGDAPRILYAFNPLYGLTFLFSHGLLSFVVMGSVFLAVTGAEALYADMGHFGRRPIQLAWSFFVLPALVLNYLGQGALLLADPQAMENPFFLMAPDWALLPLVIARFWLVFFCWWLCSNPPAIWPLPMALRSRLRWWLIPCWPLSWSCVCGNGLSGRALPQWAHSSSLKASFSLPIF